VTSGYAAHVGSIGSQFGVPDRQQQPPSWQSAGGQHNVPAQPPQTTQNSSGVAFW
jgi:hypothetical protein